MLLNANGEAYADLTDDGFGALEQSSSQPPILYGPDGLPLPREAVQALKCPEHARRILPAIQEKREGTSDLIAFLLETVFEDPGIQSQMHKGEIRHSALCGETSQDILQLLGMDPSIIKLMTIGDIELPDFIKQLVYDTLTVTAPERLREILERRGSGYELPAQGEPSARIAEWRYFNHYYRLDEACPGLKVRLARNTCLESGGMRGLNDMIAALLRKDMSEGKVSRFIHADSSFGTWHFLTKTNTQGRSAEVHQINTEQRNLLHVTPEQVDEFYAKHPNQPNNADTWYITPVGNPSGTKQDPYKACKAILKHNPNAVIILDIVYARTLEGDEPAELMARTFRDQEVMNRVIVVESFSKSHGIPGIRLGSYSSVNDGIFRKLQEYNIGVSAGNGIDKSALTLAFCGRTPEETAAIFEKDQDTYRRLHRFWGRERKGLHEYLIKSGKFPHLFHPDQSHIRPEDLEKSLGLYLFLRMQEGVDFTRACAETKAIGHFNPLHEEPGQKYPQSGTPYIRYSIGKMTKPTYSSEPI